MRGWDLNSEVVFFFRVLKFCLFLLGYGFFFDGYYFIIYCGGRKGGLIERYRIFFRLIVFMFFLLIININ